MAKYIIITFNTNLQHYYIHTQTFNHPFQLHTENQMIDTISDIYYFISLLAIGALKYQFIFKFSFFTPISLKSQVSETLLVCLKFKLDPYKNLRCEGTQNPKLHPVWT
jgi:hypothetical protein